jgi:hypothetical protein
VHTFFATGLILAAVLLTIIVCGIAFRLRRQRHLAALLAADPSYVRPGWVGNSYLAFPRIWEREEVRAPPPPIHELLVSGEAEKEAWVDIMVSIPGACMFQPDASVTASRRNRFASNTIIYYSGAICCSSLCST